MRPSRVNQNDEKEIVDSIAVLMINNYVYPDIGKQIAKHFKKQLKDNKYKDFKNIEQFSHKLNEDILSINNDRYLGIRFDPEMESMLNNVNPEDDNDSLFFINTKRRNFDFKKLKILQGNIGYLDLRGFTPTNIAGKLPRRLWHILSIPIQ